jgi:hypothetical protein
MRRSYDVKTSYLKIGAIVLLCVVLIFCGIVLLNKWEENRGRFPEQDFGDPTIEYNGIDQESPVPPSTTPAITYITTL